MEKEIWKDIEGYEGYYQVSNLGRVKSLKRFAKHPKGGKKVVNERVLKENLGKKGYLTVSLYRNGGKTKEIHQLVAMEFLNHTPCGYRMVVDHIDNNKINNRFDNLRIVTQRENTSKKHIKSSSEYTGVSWCRRSNKWLAAIRINGRKKSLGLFLNEIDAHNAYQDMLKKIEC